MNYHISCQWLTVPRFKTLYPRATEYVAVERRGGLLQAIMVGVAFRAVRTNTVRHRAALWCRSVDIEIGSKSLECVISYLLTPCSRVLLEKLTGVQTVKKFPKCYGTRRFITAFTSARHLSLSWASSIHSTLPHPTSWRSILILSSHLRFGLPRGRVRYIARYDDTASPL